MLKICKNDKNKVIKQVQQKLLDGIIASNSNLIDEIILSMFHEGIIDCLDEGFNDKRKANSFIPFRFIMSLAIVAKMKTRTSLTDIPYAIKDHRTLAELGYNVIGTDDEEGWLTEGTIRYLLKKYKSEELFEYYNRVVQDCIFNRTEIETNIHILDCTKIAVNFDNENYENATVSLDRRGKKMRSYKLATLRGIYGDSGLIEDVRFGTAITHDVKLSEDMLKTTPCFHAGDILIMDRGFVSREIVNHLKSKRKVDIFMPLKKNMEAHTLAVSIAESEENWLPHPTRDNQMIHFVTNLGEYWSSTNPENDVDINVCVVWMKDEQSYSVFATTDLSMSAKDIILTYQIRPEIEEDFRQLKEFWKLEDFKSTKLNVISFHLICTLFGYLFYQLYLNTDDGQKYISKCLPAILKKYKEQFLCYLVLYSGDYFCSMSLKEFVLFWDSCEEEVREYILGYLK